MDHDPNAMKGDLVLALIKASGCDTYLSGTGAKAYMDDSEFEKAGIKLIYQEFKHPTYIQKNAGADGFVPGMSTLDLLFNVGIDGSRELLKSIG